MQHAYHTQTAEAFAADYTEVDHKYATAHRHENALRDTGLLSAEVMPSERDGFVVALDRADADHLTEILGGAR